MPLHNSGPMESEKPREAHFAGSTISDVPAQLRAGTLPPSDLPIQAINMGGDTLIVNTRSSLAITQAGIQQST
jgi:hypothetical protein